MSDEPNGNGKAIKDRAPFVIALVLTVGYFATLYAAFTMTIPESSQRVLDVMIGNLTIVWAGAMAYYYNTTAGSARKTEIIANSEPPKNP